MNTNQYLIRRVFIDERSEWQKLWLAYLTFYQTELAESVTDLLWQRIQDCQHEIRCYVTEDVNSSQLVGLAHYYPHTNTWTDRPVVFLNDLFVDPDSRGGGLGEALIRKIIEDSKHNNWGKLYWHTAQTNEQARRLYDRITGGADGFIRYKMAAE